MHTIRFCKANELCLLQDFLRKYWNKSHIFTYDDELLLWQHGNSKDKIINFVVAFNEASKEFDAILGFIPTSQYDITMSTKDIWLAIWKVKEEFTSSGIGMKLFLYLNHSYKPQSIGVQGMSEYALKIYKAFKYTTGLVSHFYIKNNSLNRYLIADFKIQNIPLRNISINALIKLITIKDFESASLQYQYTPYKTKNYFINRYYYNKFYKYKFYGIFQNNKIIGVFIIREILVKESKCLRIVDWIGDYSTHSLYNEFQILLDDSNAEYIDLLCQVPDEENILHMGFFKKDVENEIIPNYFEPFLKKNIIIDYAYKSKENNYAIFKADADQDRPTIL